MDYCDFDCIDMYWSDKILICFKDAWIIASHAILLSCLWHPILLSTFWNLSVYGRNFQFIILKYKKNKQNFRKYVKVRFSIEDVSMLQLPFHQYVTCIEVLILYVLRKVYFLLVSMHVYILWLCRNICLAGWDIGTL